MSLFDKFARLFTKKPARIHTSSNAHSKALLARPMVSLDTIDPGMLPAQVVNEFITNVNQLINAYNITNDISQKKGFLSQIQKKINEIDYKFPPSYFAASPEYRSTHAALFKEIKYQFTSMGINSLRDDPQESSSLPEIIANMSPEKADAVLKILHQRAGADLSGELPKLYAQNDTSREAENFRAFLQEHTVSFLGGANSKNFKVENKNGTTFVLKVDCRMDMPRNVEAYLRNCDALRDRFTPIEAERQVTCDIETGETICRTLLVTEYYPSGSVLEYRGKLKYLDEVEESVGKIFEQMAGICLDFQEAGCLFPDAKITNWLVDTNKTVRLADTKSFLFTDRNGRYFSDIPGNEYCEVLQTSSHNPPEYYAGLIQADSMHAFILGKNLYHYTSGKVGYGDNVAEYNFSSAFFKNPHGPQFEVLIKSLLTRDYTKRLSIRDALDELFMINNPEFREVLSDLKTLKFGANDPHMNAYIREKQRQVNHAEPEEKARILLDMKTMASDLKVDEAAGELRQIVDNYRKNARWFTIGMNAKATRIEQAMSKVPLEDRKALLESKKTQDVMEALASHRHFGKRGTVYLNEQGGVDPEKAAITFKNYKEQFHLQTEQLNELSTPENTSKIK